MGHPTTPRNGQAPDPDTVPVPEDAYRSARRSEAEKILPLVEETATIHKQEVITGKVRIRTVTETIEALTEANLQRDLVEVTRVPVAKVVDTAPETRIEGDVTIVPVLEEAVVSKEARVTEEVVVRKGAEQRTETVSDTVRKTEVEVEDERGAKIRGTTDRT